MSDKVLITNSIGYENSNDNNSLGNCSRCFVFDHYIIVGCGGFALSCSLCSL